MFLFVHFPNSIWLCNYSLQIFSGKQFWILHLWRRSIDGEARWLNIGLLVELLLHNWVKVKLEI